MRLSCSCYEACDLWIIVCILTALEAGDDMPTHCTPHCKLLVIRDSILHALVSFLYILDTVGLSAAFRARCGPGGTPDLHLSFARVLNQMFA